MTRFFLWIINVFDHLKRRDHIKFFTRKSIRIQFSMPHFKTVRFTYFYGLFRIFCSINIPSSFFWSSPSSLFCSSFLFDFCDVMWVNRCESHFCNPLIVVTCAFHSSIDFYGNMFNTRFKLRGIILLRFGLIAFRFYDWRDRKLNMS